METENSGENLIQTSMTIILHAGDARSYLAQALNAITNQEFELADEKINAAQREMAFAHEVQTDIIQGSAEGKTVEFSLLFTHAQDTLMTIASELMLAKQIIRIYKTLNERIEKLEQQ